ncbi:MAG: sugar ABC transporter substrate-binding protein [Epulopiscium sp.]|nr:sugar ABC transporter substrate-binding protein [Candidatus Epulonipiscium sp.]HOQ16951.1 sugar ABC transporter substrate-binding protein [Defluviitaleaceae bacterium]HPT75742.1 sugar ABC transporter substrate-binding protein [Defluviitaleaceae bacterium]
MKKRVISLLLACLMIFAVAGCSKSQSGKDNDSTPTVSKETEEKESKEPVTLNVWIMPNSGEPEKDFMDVIQPFLEENPNITVVPTVIDWGSAWTKVTTAATSGEAPDVTQLGTTWVAAVASMDALADLTPYYDEFGGAEAFLPATLPTTVIEGSDQRFAVPWFVDSRALYYRKDACEIAGVNPETDFATWDSFKEALKKLNGVEVDGKKMVALGMPGKNDWNVVHNFSWWIWGAGGDFVSDDLKTSTINSPEAFEGVKFYTELAIEGLMSMPSLEKNSAEIEALFNAGEFATIFSGGYFAKTIKDNAVKDPENSIVDKVGVAMIPEGPKGRHVFFGGSTLAVYKTTKHMDEAVKLIQFLTSKEAQIEYSKRHGNLPATKEAYEDPYIDQDPMLSVFKEQAKYGRAYPSIPGWAPSESLLQKGLSNVWDNVMGVNGPYDPERTKIELDAAAADATAVYQAN